MSARDLPGRVVEGEAVYSVSGLTDELKALLSTGYRSIWVEGEVSGYKLSPNGHAYFNLKDGGAILACVIWRSTLAKMKERLRDGGQARVRGSLDIYPPRGSYQLIVEAARPAGEGELFRLFEELKKRLAAEGLFERERKRSIPAVPRRVGVVTSPTGAAIRDFLRIVRERAAGVHIALVPAAVQGRTAAREMADALALLNRLGEADVIVVMRGGGSLEDLWAFNEETLARAVAASAIPVISAVGHEIDFTICDFVADLRLPTPTAAGMYVVRHQEEMRRAVERGVARMAQCLESALELRRERLARLSELLAARSPLLRVAFLRQRVDRLLARQAELLVARLRALEGRVGLARQELVAGTRRRLLQQRHRLELVRGRLVALNPREVLARGFALCTDEESGQVLRSPAQTAAGRRLAIDLAEGRLAARVLPEGEAR